MADRVNNVTVDVLTRGSDILARCPSFALVGRDSELAELSTVLMKLRRRNLIVTGRGGVGVSAIVLGLQASKKNLTTPVDIVGMRFFWLDTDRLFESGDNRAIHAAFERSRQTLAATPSAVLVIEDSADFVRSASTNGCTSLIHGLMGDLKAQKYQAILETSDEGLGEILKCDGDLLENCTLYEVKEPDAESLRLIVAQSKNELERHHRVRVSEGALEAAVQLTEKYKLTELRAQPDAAITLLDLALTHLCRDAHITPLNIKELRDNMLNAPAVEAEQLQGQLAAAEKEWDDRQRLVRALYREISDGEEQIRLLQQTVVSLRDQHTARLGELNRNRDTASGQASGGPLEVYRQADTPEMADVKRKISTLESLVADATRKYEQKVAEVYAGLSLHESHVLKSFSILSGIPVDKLTENERGKLRGLHEVLSARVVGQLEPTTEVAKAVKRARLGLKLPNKPSGTFMFLGPSGVGKTELAKSLAEALSVPLLRFDMSEYMEKHAVAKLIGAPPGYEGYEQGGILTNQVRRNPYSVVLFDEIEKAHTDVFNVMLQLLDDARLTDSRGLTASFKDTIVIMTTNIGTPHFLDEAVPFEESKKLALADLRAQYRPEFLGRFGGNIYAFQRLGFDVLEAIARKEVRRINELVQQQGISLVMEQEDIQQMVKGVYVAREGARSILGYLDRSLTSALADLILREGGMTGEVVARFDTESRSILIDPRSGPRAVPKAHGA
jgi:ATP-dependent Clp protease ATP-binding subunit ClpB